jgi:ribosomal protein S4E
VITKEKIVVGDSVYLDMKNEVKKVIPLSSSKEVFVMSGKYIGNKGKVESISEGKIKVKINDKSTVLNTSSVVAL